MNQFKDCSENMLDEPLYLITNYKKNQQILTVNDLSRELEFSYNIIRKKCEEIVNLNQQGTKELMSDPISSLCLKFGRGDILIKLKNSQTDYSKILEIFKENHIYEVMSGLFIDISLPIPLYIQNALNFIAIFCYLSEEFAENFAALDLPKILAEFFVRDHSYFKHDESFYGNIYSAIMNLLHPYLKILSNGSEISNEEFQNHFYKIFSNMVTSLVEDQQYPGALKFISRAINLNFIPSNYFFFYINFIFTFPEFHPYIYVVLGSIIKNDSSLIPLILSHDFSELLFSTWQDFSKITWIYLASFLLIAIPATDALCSESDVFDSLANEIPIGYIFSENNDLIISRNMLIFNHFKNLNLDPFKFQDNQDLTPNNTIILLDFLRMITKRNGPSEKNVELFFCLFNSREIAYNFIFDFLENGSYNVKVAALKLLKSLCKLLYNEPGLLQLWKEVRRKILQRNGEDSIVQLINHGSLTILYYVLKDADISDEKAAQYVANLHETGFESDLQDLAFDANPATLSRIQTINQIFSKFQFNSSISI